MILRAAVNRGAPVLLSCLANDMAIAHQRSIVMSSQQYQKTAQQHQTKREDAQKNYSSQYNEIKTRLATSLDQSSNNSSSCSSINISDVKNMILLSKREEDLDLSMRALKKAGLKRDETKSAASDLLEQIFFLKKRDKMMTKLASDQDFQSAVFDHDKNVNLMLGMIKSCYEKKNYQKIVELFDSFLSYHHAHSPEGLAQFRGAFILYLDMVSEALLEMNNKYALDKSKHFYERLNDRRFDCLKPVPLSNIALLAIKQNEPEFAQSVIDRIRIPFLQKNLQILRLLRMNQVNEAYQLTEKSLQSKKFVLFADIHQILEQDVTSTKDADLINKMKEMNKRFTPSNLVNKTLEQKLKLMRYDAIDEKLSPPLNQLNQERRQFNASQKEQRSNSVDKNDTRKVVKKQEKQPMIKSPEPPRKVVVDDSRLIEYAELFNNKKYTQIVSDFESKYLTGKTTTISSIQKDISTNLVSFVTASLLQLNNPAAFRRLRDIIQILEENQVRISDASKVHAFLLAINQNDPHFALGYSTLTGLDKKSPSLFQNLRVISLCKNKLYSEAFESAYELLDMKVNKFNNEGCFYPLTIESLETAAASNSLRGVNSKLDEILTTVRLEDRIANFDLYQFSLDNLQNATALQVDDDSDEGGGDKSESDDDLNDINQRIHKAYFVGDPVNVINQFVDHFKSNAASNAAEEIKPETVDLIVKACTQIDIDRQLLIRVVSILRRNGAAISPASLMELFSEFIKTRNPSGALMLLEKFDQPGSFSSKYPDVYANCLIIGFGLTLRHRIALEKFEGLLNTPTEPSEPFKGKLFPMTIECLKQSIDRSRDKQVKYQLEELIERAVGENRVNNLELCSSLSEY